MTEEIEQRDRIFRLNDKVMQIKNDYTKEFIDDDSMGVFNGDIGRVTYVDPIDETIDVLFDDKTASFTKKRMRRVDAILCDYDSQIARK